MGFDKVEKHFSSPVKITGNNLGDVENATFCRISSNNGEMQLFNDYPEMKKQIKVLEDFTIKVYSEAEKEVVTPLPVEEGKVVLKTGTPYHRANHSLDTLKNIAVGGILPSEWFGKLESENEGRFCAFLSRVLNEGDAQGFRGQLNNVNGKVASKNNCVIYFDESNPIMKMLLSMDYFEYEEIKRTNPEKLKELYPQEVIDIMDKLIEPISPAGKKMHDNPKLPFYDWLAIPGGIPPQFVNGICVHSSNLEIMQSLDEISEMFPNATIFDEKQNVLRMAKSKSTDKGQTNKNPDENTSHFGE